MPAVAMTGQDVVIINGRILVDLADGTCADLTFPNDIATVKTGKNGNSLYGLNESGRQAMLVLRVVRASDDDKFLQQLLSLQQANFAGFVLLTGQFIKKIGDGAGDITNDTYVTSGGVFTKQIEGKQNVEGDSDQSVAIYTVKFSNSPRAIT